MFELFIGDEESEGIEGLRENQDECYELHGELDLKKGELTREDRQENARIYAREVEHAEENMADLEEELMFS